MARLNGALYARSRYQRHEPVETMGYNYLPLALIPASGTQFLIYVYNDTWLDLNNIFGHDRGDSPPVLLVAIL